MKLMKMRKIKIPVDKNHIVVVYTKNICTSEELDCILGFFKRIDWDSEELIIVPSEYIDKVKFVKRWRKI